MSYWNPFREKSQAASAEGERCGAVDDDWLECVLPLGHKGPHSDRASGEGGERWSLGLCPEWTLLTESFECPTCKRQTASIEVVPAAALTAAEERAEEAEQEARLNLGLWPNEAIEQLESAEARLAELVEAVEKEWPRLRNPKHPQHEPAPHAGRRLRIAAEKARAEE